MAINSKAIAGALAVVAFAGLAQGGATLEIIGQGIGVTDMSEDGSVLVGNTIFDGFYETWRWVEGDPNGWTRLGRATVPVVGTGAGHPDVSYDGTRVSATIMDDVNQFMTQGLWTEGSGWDALLPPMAPDGGTLDSSYGSAWGLSGDGTTVTGFYWTRVGGDAHPSAWIDGQGITGLEYVIGRSGRVNCSNFDGTVVGGWHEEPTGEWNPNIWRNGQRMQVETSPVLTMVESISADGNVAVGSMYNFQAARRNAARWDWNGTSYEMTDLGVLPGTPQTFIGYVSSLAVSDDGSIITGINRFQNNGPFSTETGFVWTEADGMRDLHDVLADYGLAVPAGHQISSTLVSPDGSAIAFVTLNQNELSFLDYWTYLFRFPVQCPGDINGDEIVDFTDLNSLLSAFGQAGQDLPADLDGDGVVGFSDLNILLTAFGDAC